MKETLMRRYPSFVFVICTLGALSAALTSCAGGKDNRPTPDGGMRCLIAAECNDGIDCTVDTCGVAGLCEHSPLDRLCPMGQSCNATSGCRAGSTCTTPADCNDMIDCTFDSCAVGGVCNHMPLDRLCTGAGESCDVAMGCQRTGCATAVDCNDTVACTVDMCAVGNVCTNTPVDTLCTGAGEVCGRTGCYVPMPCTLASDCNDGNFCNGDEVCDPEFGCQPSLGPHDCNDRDPCTTEVCDTTSDSCVFTCDDATATCPMCPEAPIDYNGTFNITPPPTQMCAFGMVNYNISSIVLRYVGGILSVTAGSFTLTQPGPTSAAGPSGGSFDVSYRVSGGCIETYRLVGMFTDADHFTGTWTSTYVEVDGSCAFSGCAPLTVAVTGVRAP
jgi:hypothetical protein